MKVEVAFPGVELNADNGFCIEAMERCLDRLHVLGNFVGVWLVSVVDDERFEGATVIERFFSSMKAAARLAQPVDRTLDVAAGVGVGVAAVIVLSLQHHPAVMPAKNTILWGNYLGHGNCSKHRRDDAPRPSPVLPIPGSTIFLQRAVRHPGCL
jgi:hypothetical protein